MKTPFRIKHWKLYTLMSIAYAILYWLSNKSKFPGDEVRYLVDNLWRTPYVFVVNYIFFEYAVPFVLKKREYIVINFLFGVVILFCFMIAWSYGMYLWRDLGVVFTIYKPLSLAGGKGHTLESQMAFSMGSVFLFMVGRHLYHYIKLQDDAKKLLIEKKEAELNYLRSQTNPHFLFNTLNNIYSLSRDKSDMAPESILRLSKILRFMLYETGGNYIGIEQEVKIIEDYIELEKLRYDETLRVDFKFDVEDKKQAIPPLLLMPLVENAFKHGVSETRGQPFVDILLLIHDKRLTFVVKNSTGSPVTETTVKENIGLSNLRRHLQLLFKDYDLSIMPEANLFTTSLTINLNSHV
jgi:two-component system LytT family sensor kinase